jgi:malonyl-CoA/methylmalonyl-CoA synthetase
MAVPTMYSKLIEEYRKMSNEDQRKCRDACKKFRLMVSGSMALPSPILESWKDISGHFLLERYGMTEAGMILSNPLHGIRKVGYVGKPLSGVECKVVDGELRIKSPGMFSCYWNKPAETAKSFDQEGYFMTGDIVEIDEDGDYKISGRSSVDIIKSSGYKISALDIERVLLSHPLILECAIVGIPDESYGQIIGAVISTRSVSKHSHVAHNLNLCKECPIRCS